MRDALATFTAHALRVLGEAALGFGFTLLYLAIVGLVAAVAVALGLLAGAVGLSPP